MTTKKALDGIYEKHVEKKIRKTFARIQKKM